MSNNKIDFPLGISKYVPFKITDLLIFADTIEETDEEFYYRNNHEYCYLGVGQCGRIVGGLFENSLSLLKETIDSNVSYTCNFYQKEERNIVFLFGDLNDPNFQKAREYAFSRNPSLLCTFVVVTDTVQPQTPLFCHDANECVILIPKHVSLENISKLILDTIFLEDSIFSFKNNTILTLPFTGNLCDSASLLRSTATQNSKVLLDCSTLLYLLTYRDEDGYKKFDLNEDALIFEKITGEEFISVMTTQNPCLTSEFEGTLFVGFENLDLLKSSM